MRIRYHRDFERGYQKLSEQKQVRVRERIELFANDAFHPLLNNHALHGKYQGYRSININGGLRVIYRELKPDTAHFVEIGTHSDLYS
ncbi:MAG: hypothetical protein A3C11_02120 [Candidatus Sungbacteria bacterium RIFCSPHIGHO2_02_FULL_49_12]|uniref:Plasmid stabilization protein n=1 Tax=Candidatus Sungbacteria bacterium RIFCSPHIGHO2_02_FULL_49_12 TaxID=1802271 RepID=A0A1G2KRN6_9BACT|nr:MAG: hypothetical protein A3C11_02120 [Candidatus Sungbacteria bacterium RIFCSPHIGHO2_02_FULL_49_12]